MKKKYKITFEPNFGGLDCIVFEIQTELKQDAVDTAVSKMKELQGENWEQHYSQGRIKEIYVIDNYDKEEINMEEIREDKENYVFVEGNEDDVKNFIIGKYPVTQKEYEEIMGYNPSHFTGNPNNPVEMVSWYDVVEYCNARSIQEGLTPYYTYTKIGDNNLSNVDIVAGANGYRLPTDAEWEYAARGGKVSKGYKYSGSDNIDEVALYTKNRERTYPVGLRKPNELGIYDMSGNVWEWTGTNTIGGSDRYLRGGSWYDIVFNCEVDSQDNNDPNGRSGSIGFRVCRCQ